MINVWFGGYCCWFGFGVLVVVLVVCFGLWFGMLVDWSWVGGWL